MNNLVWVDLETTGLDPDKEQILEVACIVTDGQLNELGRWERVIRPERLDLMALQPVVFEMHLANGLLAAVVRTVAEPHALKRADFDLACWLCTVVGLGLTEDEESLSLEQRIALNRSRMPQLAGSTIDFDRAFLRKHMPDTFDCLHYRNLDVSSFNEMAKRMWPAVYDARPKGGDKAHRGMADIEESLRVARHYATALGPVLAPAPAPDAM